MRQIDRLLQWFVKRNNFATLHEIMMSGEPWVWEVRARFTDLRKQGYKVTCDRAKRPSENLYRITHPVKEPVALIP